MPATKVFFQRLDQLREFFQPHARTICFATLATACDTGELQPVSAGCHSGGEEA
jgi:hypothetical protein